MTVAERGALRKMILQAEDPVSYLLPLGEARIPLNPLLEQRITLRFQKEIRCIHCGRKTSKSFNQGYCYPCFKSLARCDMCIVKPENCHYHLGTCREPQWAQGFCMQDHVLYLANTAGLKVGITRSTQLPTRWLDQGAVQALALLRAPTRRDVGLLEAAFRKCVSDRTDWRRMLGADTPPVDLPQEREALLARLESDLAQLDANGEGRRRYEENAAPQHFRYPVREYPQKIQALNLEKTPCIEGTLLGMKGQYLILDTGVLNIRKIAGYLVEFQT